MGLTGHRMQKQWAERTGMVQRAWYLQPDIYLSIPELYYIPEDGACIDAVGIDAYAPMVIY